MRVYTTGYWGRKITDFIKILKEYNITVVVDVRRFPRSKDPAFNKDNLESFLGENGIKYVSLGESLGGFVREGYEKYMESQKFREGFESLLNIIREETVALMCMEKNAKYCHRRFIAQRLEEMSVEIINI